MATDVKLPEMGEGIESGTVVRLLVKEGDTVAEGQGLMELETDKALVEVPSDAAGKVSKIHVKPGEQVKVGAALVSLDGEGRAAVPAAKSDTGETPAPPKAQSEQQQPAPAAQPPVAAPKTAEAAEVHPPASNGQRPASAAQEPAASPKPPAATNGAGGDVVPAGPATRRLARELGIELRQVRGSGQGGRITPEDVLAVARQRMGGGGAPATPDLPDFAKWGGVERKPLTQVRKLIAEHMSLSWRTVPHVTQFERADVTELEALRKKYEPEAELGGGKMTLTVLLIRAVVSALKAQPQFNASLDERAGEIVYKGYVNLGIAVDTERGLLVPVLRDADRKDVMQIAAELPELAERARSGHIDVEELRGGTFTISNQGGIGGAEFTPIVNWPEVAILGVGRARMEPWVVGDAIKPRLICPLALSYDHRVIDGAMAARFIRRLKESLESPERLLMGL